MPSGRIFIGDTRAPSTTYLRIGISGCWCLQTSGILPRLPLRLPLPLGPESLPIGGPSLVLAQSKLMFQLKIEKIDEDCLNCLPLAFCWRASYLSLDPSTYNPQVPYLLITS